MFFFYYYSFCILVTTEYFCKSYMSKLSNGSLKPQVNFALIFNSLPAVTNEKSVRVSTDSATYGFEFALRPYVVSTAYITLIINLDI